MLKANLLGKKNYSMKNRTGGVLKRSPSPVSSEMFIHPERVSVLGKSSASRSVDFFF